MEDFQDDPNDYEDGTSSNREEEPWASRNKGLAATLGVALAVALVGGIGFGLNSAFSEPEPDPPALIAQEDFPTSKSVPPSTTKPSAGNSRPGTSARTVPNIPAPRNVAPPPAPPAPLVEEAPPPPPPPPPAPEERPAPPPPAPKPEPKKQTPRDEYRPEVRHELPPPPPERVQPNTSQRDLGAFVEAKPKEASGVPTGIVMNGKEAPIVPIGTTGSQDAATLTTPEDVSKIGWYASSAKPGEENSGTIVMTGHINYAGVTGYASQFITIKEGDEVVIKTEEGEKRYRAEADARDIAKSRDAAFIEATKNDLNRMTGPEALVLVTCGGEFDPNSPLGYQSNYIAVLNPV